jgi:hypothetical protein
VWFVIYENGIVTLVTLLLECLSFALNSETDL